MKKYYQTLGLEEGASKKDIEYAYNRLSKELDPASNDNLEFFVEEYSLVQVAYHALIEKNFDDKIDLESSRSKTNINSSIDLEEVINKSLNKNPKNISLKPQKKLNFLKVFSLLVLLTLILTPFVLIQFDNISDSKKILFEAKALYSKDSLTKSIVKLDQSLAKYYLSESLKLKGDIRFKQRRYDLSTIHYRSVINKNHTFDSIKFDYGYSLIMNKEFDLGMSFISEGIGNKSTSHSINYVNKVLSNNNSNKRNHYIALVILNSRLKYSSDSSLIFNRARLHHNLGMYTESISDYSVYIKKNQNSWPQYFNRALAYYQNSEYKRSISDFNKSLEFDNVERIGSIYNHLGKSYYNLNQFSVSYDNFKIALSYDYPVSNSAGSLYWHVKRKLNR